jgi:NhaP-type Na+/H+ or K+/H+ antiporter
VATSLALIALFGLLADHIFKKLRMPGLVGMLLVGVLMGPYVFNLMSADMMEVSADFRMIALIVILLRAGLKIRRDTINRVGKTALFMSFLPSTFEGLTVMFLAPLLFGMTIMQGAILGFIVAAVSPAVVVPSMIKFMEKGRGSDKGIPTMVLASSSLDNAYVIVVFSTVLGMYLGSGGNPILKIAEIPVSIVLGIAAGIVCGLLIHQLFVRYKPRATKKGLIIIGTGILLFWLEQHIRKYVPFSGLLGVMATGFVILEKDEEIAHAISNKLSKIWVLAEILLFVLVGAQVNIHVALDAGLAGAAIVAGGLVARSIGTWLSVSRSGFNRNEKLFCVIAYVPKATVQAAIGAIPLSMGVKGGEVILAVAVLSIILTAPLGAIGIDKSGKKFLAKGPPV